MTRPTAYYNVVGVHGETVRIPVTVNPGALPVASLIARPSTRHQVAARAAEDFYHWHGGDGAAWPITVRLYNSPDGPCLGVAECHVAIEPSFYAYPGDDE